MALSIEGAYKYLENAYNTERLSHAFGIFAEKSEIAEEFASRLLSLVNRAPEPDDGGGLFGDAMPEPTLTHEAKPLQEWQSETVRIVTPNSKSRLIRVEQLRALEKSFQVSVGDQQWKVGVICDAERMNEEAQNAFLKTLEEPPQRTLLLLISTRPQALLATVHSRITKIQLNTPNEQQGVLSETEEQLLNALNGFVESGHTMADALALRGQFSAILLERKAQITKENDVALKAENEQYKNSTEGDWLKRREEHYSALAEAGYQTERAKLIHFMTKWLMQALKHQSGITSKHSLLSPAIDGYLANRTPEQIMQQINALQELEWIMNTNAQEQVSLDVSFIKGFVDV